ncbi:phenylacetate--CoA ligase family protein [Nitratifractor salsuginis]|uniref:phenylacetate--CoA ligase family protein n=1 Tax=Nitratifractor salsuginis TaxID=269261 RepID=UPI0011D113C3|nr:phenylacetate--CoA ligase family protein [Nitratifractor salsuginis]
MFELIYKWRYYNIDTIVKEIEMLRSLPKEDFLQWQEKKKWEIAQYLYDNNTFYRDYVGDVFPEKWEELPIITKSDLQIDLDRLISKPYNIKNLYINNTSGSSGHPLTFTKSYYTQARVWAYKKYFLAQHGLTLSSKEARFYGMPKSFKGKIIQKTKDFILNRNRFVVFEFSDEIFEEWIKRFKRIAFEYIYGYTSAIVLFSRYLIKKRLILKEICPTLKLVIVTSETCSVEDKAIIKKATGVKVRNEYGSAEAGIFGFECDRGHIHLLEENLYFETNDRNELLVTDLSNKSFPMIRYNIGDIASLENQKCTCGNRNRYISKLEGRTNDVALLPSGKQSPGLTFYYVSRALLESSGVLKEFIIRQTALDTFEFDVVSDKKISQKDIEELEYSVAEYLEPGLKIIVNQVDKINRPSSGKIKHFYSEINRKLDSK